MIDQEEFMRAARHASGVFRSAALELATPLLVLNIAIWLLRALLYVVLPRGADRLVENLPAAILPVAQYAAAFLIAERYFRRQSGLPAGSASFDTLWLPAVQKTIWGLYLRLILWGLGTFGVAAGLWLLMVLVRTMVLGASSTRHHGGLGSGFATAGVALFLIVLTLLFSRYFFVLPLQAMWAGRKPDAIETGVALASTSRRMVLTLAFLEVMLTSVISLFFLHAAVVRFGAESWLHRSILLLVTIYVAFVVTWFVLLKSSLLERMRDRESMRSVGD